MFLKMVLSFRVLSFCLNCIFSTKTLLEAFREKLATKLFQQKWVKAKYGNIKFQTENFMTVSRLFRE